MSQCELRGVPLKLGSLGKVMDSQDHLVHLGFCRKPHGIKGGFSFSLFNVEDSVLQKGFPIVLKGLSGSVIDEQKYVIAKISFGNKVIAYLEGVNDRNQVEELLPFEIYCYRSDLPEDEENFYLIDLIGMRVVSHTNANEIGIVDSIYDNGAQDVIVIVKGSGEKIELPFIDNFFPRYDLEQGFIEVILPEIE
jgi:16S rRNA processing protein RimM